jgi:hypothetical protein
LTPKAPTTAPTESRSVLIESKPIPIESKSVPIEEQLSTKEQEKAEREEVVQDFAHKFRSGYDTVESTMAQLQTILKDTFSNIAQEIMSLNKQKTPELLDPTTID